MIPTISVPFDGDELYEIIKLYDILRDMDFEYNDDHERYMIEQIENKIYQAQENQALKLLSGMN